MSAVWFESDREPAEWPFLPKYVPTEPTDAEGGRLSNGYVVRAGAKEDGEWVYSETAVSLDDAR